MDDCSVKLIPRLSVYFFKQKKALWFWKKLESNKLTGDSILGIQKKLLKLIYLRNAVFIQWLSEHDLFFPAKFYVGGYTEITKVITGLGVFWKNFFVC